MFHVFNVNHNVNRCPAIGSTGFDIADVGIAVADHSGQLLEHGRTVVTKHGQLHWISGFAAGRGRLAGLGPFHGDPAVSFVHQVVDVRTAHSVHSHAFAAGHVAHDGFSPNGIATSRTVHHEVVVAFDLDGASISALSKHAPDHRA